MIDEDLVQLKKKFGLNPEEKYQVPQSVYELYAARTRHGQEYENGWNALFEKYGQAYPKEASEIRRRFAGELPEGWESALPRFTPNDAALATRKSSEVVLNAIANGLIPDFTSGCADLSTSTLNRWKTAVDFQHVRREHQPCCLLEKKDVLLLMHSHPQELVNIVASISDMVYANMACLLS